MCIRCLILLLIRVIIIDVVIACGSGTLAILRRHERLGDKDDSLRELLYLASLHDRDNDLLLVDLLEKTRVLEHGRPIYTIGTLAIAEAQYFIVHGLVRCKHSDQVPNILRAFIVSVEQL